MDLSQTHFYIIDDDLSFGRSLKRLLNAGHLTADYFGSGQSFFDSVPSSEKGVAVVDIHMPGCDGFEVMSRMQDLNYHMTVIVTTGYAQEDSRDTAIQNGAVGFLQKPFSWESLEELVGKSQEDDSPEQ